jgi:hypothetical protein
MRRPRGAPPAGARGADVVGAGRPGPEAAGARRGAGAVFFPLVFMALTSLTTVDLLCNERGLVIKEVLGGYYRPVSYYLSKGAPAACRPRARARARRGLRPGRAMVRDGSRGITHAARTLT